ncbi:MAG: DUF4595 domain-containing protein [Clostridium sp.]|nr:DUF4595 domain-containing protein [Prevotella sp.]MCM1428857.1 DUF4595 domain-containing protein [Clostridium sp.]MCM1475236.1 DUF4595 domain-containing protein [Muribaculaceae bacterium]
MKKHYILLAVALLAALPSGARSLESIVETYPYGSSTTSIKYDTSGRLIEIIDDHSTFTFDYSKTAEKILVLTRVDQEPGEPIDTTIYNMTLNDDGNVVKTTSIENGVPDDDYLVFGYTGQFLTSFEQHQGTDIEETRLTWYGGNITGLTYTDNYHPGEAEISTIKYTDIENVGNLCLLERFFDIDIDDMEYVALAGFLGEVPANLPSKISTTEFEATVDTTTLEWATLPDGYPSSAKITDKYETDTLTFNWSAESSVATVGDIPQGSSRYFTPAGFATNAHAKGLIIEVLSNGKVVKRYNK